MGRLNTAAPTDELASGYAGPRDRPPFYRPHDLVYLSADALPESAPDWAGQVLAAGQPAVVRRAVRQADSLPLGIRGSRRDQRHAILAPLATLGLSITPEALVSAAPAAWRAADIPALAALGELRAIMADWPEGWGIGGAVGYELTTGYAVTHSESDIDVIVRAPGRPSIEILSNLVQRLADLSVRCDVQLETPAGGVALADWLGTAGQVLIKSDQGPYLATDPWAIAA